MSHPRFHPPKGCGKQAPALAIGFTLQLGASLRQLLKERPHLGVSVTESAMLHDLVVQQRQIMVLTEAVGQAM